MVVDCLGVILCVCVKYFNVFIGLLLYSNLVMV